MPPKCSQIYRIPQDDPCGDEMTEREEAAKRLSLELQEVFTNSWTEPWLAVARKALELLHNRHEHHDAEDKAHCEGCYYEAQHCPRCGSYLVQACAKCEDAS